MTIALFAAAVLAPAVDQLVRPDTARDPTRELRVPAPRPGPPTGFGGLRTWPGRYEAFYDDTFGLRDQLLRAHSIVALYGFGAAPSPILFPGRDDWIFYAEERSVETWRGLNVMTLAELTRWKQQLEARRDWLRKRGTSFVYVVIPNKEQIYPDKLPAAMNSIGPTRLDQFVEFMRKNSDVDVVDLRAALRAERAYDNGDDWTYYPAGTHWTNRGAWAGWNEILAHLRVHFPAVDVMRREDFMTVEFEPIAGDSWASQLYLDKDFVQRIFDFAPRGGWRSQWWAVDFDATSTPTVIGGNPRGPRIFLLHDSFGSWVFSLAAEISSELRTAKTHLLNGIDAELFAADVVIQMYSERSLVHAPWPFESHEERIERVKFASYAPLGEPLDVSSPSSLTKYGLAKIESRAENADHALVLDFPDERSGVLTPALDPPPGQRVALHVELSASASTVLNIWYRTVREPQWVRRQVVQTFLRKGRNDLYLAIEGAGADEIAGPMLIRPSMPGVTLELVRFEARSFEP